MVLSFIHTKSDRFIRLIELWSEKKFWTLRLTAVSFLLSLFTAFPSYDLFFKDYDGYEHYWQAISQQIDHPLTPQKHEAGTHEANIAFRITVPLLLYACGMKDAGITVHIVLLFTLQLLALWTLLFTLSKITYAISEDKIIATLLTLAFALTYSCNSLPLDIWGCMDCICYCLLGLALVSSSPLLIFLLTLAAGFADERALIASSLLMIWNGIRSKKIDGINVTDLLPNRSPGIAIVCSWITYFLLRFLLTTRFGFETNPYTTNVAVVVLKEAVSNIPLGLWSALEGFWIFIVLALLALILHRRWIVFLVFAACLFLITVVAFSVLDITRSLAYLFPAALISILILLKTETRSSMRHLSLLVFVVCLFPTYYVGGQHFSQWLFPLPLQVLRMLTGSETFGVSF